MGELHVVSALTDKRAELGGVIAEMEKQIIRHRAELTHLDAVLNMFAPDLVPEQIRPRAIYRRNSWFRHGEGPRKIFDTLRASGRPLASREIAERLMAERGLDPTDRRVAELVQKTVHGCLKRAAGKVEAVAIENGATIWRLAD